MSAARRFGDAFEPGGLLTLTTDFGIVDAYVGTMKGVAYGVDPALRIVDLVHTVRAQDVREAAFHLRHAAPHFPGGTVHLAVVDPGVGTERVSLVASWEDQLFVAPDNGLLPALFQGADVEYGILDDARFLAEDASATFHGRDLYAPAAAALASGRVSPADAIRRPIDASEVVHLEHDEPVVSDAGVRGTVVLFDHFGNALTDIDTADDEVREIVERKPRVVVGGVEVGWVRTFGDAPDGDVVALVDSFGLVEIAQVGGSAEAALSLDVGDTVSLELED